MTKPKLKRIEVQGFRSFGQTRQAFDLPASVAVFKGGNSQGKTSLAEALEFLFTGQIARRELLASAKDEFCEALRNAHAPDGFPVVVEAHIESNGKLYKLSRTLLEDYRRDSAGGCVSRIEIDGDVCTDNDIESRLGIFLSQPPLRAPILAQHTLGYLFSASPTDRAAYFRAILDTQDLEDFRLAVAGLQPLLKPPSLPLLEDLALVEAMPALASTIGTLRKAKTETDLQKAVCKSAGMLLEHIDITPAATLVERAEQIDVELQRRRALTFPLELFSRSTFAPWPGVPTAFSSALDRFISERAKVDKETRRLVELFKAALLLPHLPAEHQPIDCPLCGAEETLTADRVKCIRDKVATTEAYSQAVADLTSALRTIESDLAAAVLAIDRATPRFIRETAFARRTAGFTVTTIQRLVSDLSVVNKWLSTIRPLWRAALILKRVIKTTRAALSTAINDLPQWSAADELTTLLAGVADCVTKFEAALSAYEAPSKELVGILKTSVDQSADTGGWEALVRLCRDTPGLWSGLVAIVLHAARVKTLEKALTEIDAANGKVLDEKFDDLSKAVKDWWDCLRPDESSYFDGVQRRSKKTRRTIDLKVGLSTKDDRSDAKIRDAIAVFSQSQLHCLGLALFLAKADHEGLGFVVLDDPFLTSDDDYRPNFVASVIEKLLKNGVETVIFTQDNKSWKEIGERWGQQGALQYVITRDDAIVGTEIRALNDDLTAMMARIQPLIKSQDPVNRKDGASRIRDAIERFAKMVVVRDRQSKGDALASITDYDGKNFSDYSQKAMNLLTKDGGHPGKLKAAYNYVTPGPHDDNPPATGELKMAYGDLKQLKKDYLD